MYKKDIPENRFMVFYVTFNNISVMSWQSVFYWRRKLEYPEKTTDLSHVTDKRYHMMLYRVHFAWAGFELITLVVMGTDCIGSCKSNYHRITITTAPYCDLIYKLSYKGINRDEIYFPFLSLLIGFSYILLVLPSTNKNMK